MIFLVRTYADSTTEFEMEDTKLATIVKNRFTDTWRMFRYQKTGKNGVCAPVPCSQWSPQDDFVYLKGKRSLIILAMIHSPH